MKTVAHDRFERSEDFITCTMAGVELSFGIFGFQPLSQGCEFLFALVVIQQMKSSYDGMDRVGTCHQDILKTAMGTTRK